MARRLARVDTPDRPRQPARFDEALTVEIAHASRGAAFSVGLVDIDGLRRVNDRWGHLEGDRCLREVALAMERSADDRPLLPLGGDEFVSSFPAATPRQRTRC